MKTFDQLSQDEQMLAVEHAIDEIIDYTANGYTPKCFEGFAGEIDDVFQAVNKAVTETSLSYNDTLDKLLRERIESNQAMKVAMLHFAGNLTKRSIYVEDSDRIDYTTLSAVAHAS